MTGKPPSSREYHYIILERLLTLIIIGRKFGILIIFPILKHLKQGGRNAKIRL